MPVSWKHVSSFLRVLAAILFGATAVGWLLYPYSIEKNYTFYSFIMMAAYLVGAVFPIGRYRTRIGLLAIGVYVLAAAATVPHAAKDWQLASQASRQAMGIRAGEMTVLLTLIIVGLRARALGRTLDHSAT